MSSKSMILGGIPLGDPRMTHIVEEGGEEAPAGTPPSIERTGEQLIVPAGMSLEAAVKLLQRRQRYEGEVTEVHAPFDVHPYDSAHALFQVLRARFGWAEAVPTRTMFGPKPPQLIAVATGPRTSLQVPWGDFRLPNIEGTVSTGFTQRDGRVIGSLSAKILRRDEAAVQSIFEDVRKFLKGGSIYQGKAIALRFFDDQGDPIPLVEPQFMDTSVDEGKLTFNDDVMTAINTNLFTPIRRLKDLVANDIPIKRGVLLAGTYGTGKTLTAKVASKFCAQAGITFIYVRQARELPLAIRFAKSYSDPAVLLFCEDIDTVTGGKRNAELNDVLNTIDGVETKGMNLITLLTTNHMERITRAMLRPGRLDAVIVVPPPDREAALKLLRIYGEGVIPDNADLTEVAAELEGAIPAVIAEVVKRAKLSQLALQKPNTKIKELSTPALLDAARTIRMQRELLKEEQELEAQPK